MILSTQTSILGPEFGDDAAIEMIAAYGFDAYDFSFHVHLWCFAVPVFSVYASSA